MASSEDLDRVTVENTKTLIDQLREAVPEIKNNSAWDDHELLRFLVARRKNVEKAAKMLKDTLEWRKKYQVDELKIYPDEGAQCLVSYRGFKFLGPDRNADTTGPFEQCYKHVGGLGWHKFDREGHPVMIERSGLHDAFGFPKNVPLGTAVKWHVQMSEFNFGKMLDALSKERGKKITTVTVILDLRGLGWHMFHLPGLRIVQAFGAIDQNNYPERLHKIFIVNAPPVFSKFWALLKVGLDRRVIEKVNIFGKDTPEQLLKYIDEENLPDFLGGKCKCAHIEHGCVPCYQPERLKQIGLAQETVAARDAFELDVVIDTEGSIIKYHFTTKDYNIHFGITYKKTEDSTDIKVIEKLASCDSHVKPVSNQFPAELGIYTFRWDNTASMLRGKSLSYSVDVESKMNEVDLKKDIEELLEAQDTLKAE